MKLTIYLFLLLISSDCLSQTIISGKLLDEQQNPIANVSVSYKKIGNGPLLGFTKTDQLGLFKLSIRINDADSVQLDFNHMSYAKRIVTVLNKTANYAYVLKSEIRQIQEVSAGKMAVYKRKDTINYSVDAFTSTHDRVIADIIKKLPGVEMKGDQILYQGKPIQKYMVNNLDLMEGRYGIINNNLPADAVKNVQIVENDQPIKILDSLIFSDQASLNLELKKFTSTGTGAMGIGLKPLLWDLNLTPMTFSKTFQMLNSFQTNNTGKDVSRNLRAFYTGGGYFSNNEEITDGPSYISLRNVSSPNFDERKWLDNRVFMLNSNVLQKLKNDLEVKGNASFFTDTRKRKGFTATQYFTTDNIIYNTESIDNRYGINVLDAGILIEKNEKEIYLRNKFTYHKRWDTDRGHLLFNAVDSIAQHRTYSDEALLNSLSMARFIGKQLVNIRSSVEYHRTPQRLAVLPGQFQNLLNEGISYEEMNQRVLFTGLRWDNSISFSRKIKKWVVSPSIALNYKRSDLDTYISTRKGENVSQLGEGYINDMQNSQLNLALGLSVFWENKNWKFHLSTPINNYYFNVNQHGVKTLNNNLRSTFNPSSSLVYLLNNNNELSTNFSVGRSFGGLDNFYNSYIISNYRSIQRYNAQLLQTDGRDISLRYTYKNTLKANFANVAYSYGSNNRDYLFATNIDSLGRSTTNILDQQSANDNHSVSAAVARFFPPLKTVIKVNGSVAWDRSDYLLNGILEKQYSFNRSATLEVINSSSSIVSGEYKSTIGYFTSKLSGNKINNIFSNNHFLTIIVYPMENHSVLLNNSYYRNNIPSQKDQFFADATYRYTIKKWQADLELTAQNLLNNNQYVTQFSSNYELIQSYFELRPRQFIISTKFRF